MKSILQFAPTHRKGAVSRLLAALTSVSFILAVGCGDKSDPAPEAAKKAAAKVDSEWTPVEVVQTPPVSQPSAAPLTASGNDATTSEKELMARAQAEAAAKAKAIGAAGSPSAPPAQSGPPPAIQALIKQGQAIDAERESIATKLRATHEKAIKSEAVAAKRKLLDDAAIKEIAKIHPGVEPEWKRLHVLIKELEGNQELASKDPSKISEATRAKFAELQTLSEKIEPLQMKVIDLPEIKKLRDDFASAVDAEVKKLDPKAEELSARHQELSAELQTLQQKFMDLQKQFMPQAPPAPAAATPPTPSPPGK